MSNEEIEKVLEELHQVDISHLNGKALRLFNAIMSIADERDLYKKKLDEANAILKENEFEYDNIPCNYEETIEKLKKHIIKEKNK